jgi:hypothetical protein
MIKTVRILPVALALAVAPQVARADELAELEAKGEALAKQSEYTQAIEAFKAADHIKQRANHACMIGLAYMRRELWPQAELFFALCEKRAAPGDQPPAWIDEAEHQLARKLSAAQIPVVTIVVQPSKIDAHLTVSSFATDEVFAPQAIHLAPGKHVVEVSAAGYLPQQRMIAIEPGEPQTVVFVLDPDQSAPVKPSVTRSTSQRSSQRSLVPWGVMGTGAALVGIAAIYDLAALQPARDRLSQAQSPAAYDAFTDDFTSARDTTLGLFAVGALAIGVGAVLHYTVFAEADSHGGAVVVGWRR